MSRNGKTGKEGANPNHMRAVYYFNVIVLCFITIAMVLAAGYFLYQTRQLTKEVNRLENEMEELAGADKILYTKDEMDEAVALAQKNASTSERRALLMQIQSSLESGNSTTTMLRNLFTGSVIVTNSGQYYFYPILNSVKKNGFQTSDFKADELGRLTYVGNESNVSVRLGMDVGDKTESVDWQTALEDGITFSMLRIGTFGEDGTLQVRESFEEQLTAASDAGMEVGCMFDFTALDREDAAAQAAAVVEYLEPMKERVTFPVGVCLSMPAEGSEAANLSKRERTYMLMAAFDTLAEAGYTPILYGNMASLIMLTDLDRINDYAKWLAEPSGTVYYPYDFTMWQYAEGLEVQGVTGTVGMDLYIRRASLQ